MIPNGSSSAVVPLTFEVSCVQNGEVIEVIQPFRARGRVICVRPEKIRGLRGAASVADASVVGNTEYDGVYIGCLCFRFV